MSKRFLAAPALALALVLACSDDPAAPQFATTCTIVLSGALSQTLTCSTYIQSTYLAADDTARVSGGIGATQPALAVSIRKKGSAGFAVGTYTQADATVKGFVSASNGSNGWIASGAGITGAAVQGTWTLQITSVTDSATANGKVQKLHGQLDATMPSSSGGGASLTAKVTF